MGITDLMPSPTVLEEELSREFPNLSRDKCALVAAFIAARLDETNRRSNALLLSKILMRLQEAGDSQVVPASLAFAVDLTPLFLRRQACKTPDEAARVLGISPRKFKAEIKKSREFLYE